MPGAAGGALGHCAGFRSTGRPCDWASRPRWRVSQRWCFPASAACRNWASTRSRDCSRPPLATRYLLPRLAPDGAPGVGLRVRWAGPRRWRRRPRRGCAGRWLRSRRRWAGCCGSPRRGVAAWPRSTRSLPQRCASMLRCEPISARPMPARWSRSRHRTKRARWRAPSRPAHGSKRWSTRACSWATSRPPSCCPVRPRSAKARGAARGRDLAPERLAPAAAEAGLPAARLEALHCGRAGAAERADLHAGRPRGHAAGQRCAGPAAARSTRGGHGRCC